MADQTGVHLTRTDENVDEIEALAGILGGRVGLGAVVADLDQRARRTLAPGRAVHRALTWAGADRRDRRWWPQGISTSADSSDTEDFEGRRLLVVTWYAKDRGDGHRGSRVSFLDLDSRRYRHVLLVEPVVREGRVTFEPLKIHAGGIVWSGPFLHVAATARGFVSCRLDDILRVPDELVGDEDGLGVDPATGRVSTYGYRYVLPVRFAYRAAASKGVDRLRYSFLSLDRATTPHELVVGEYGNRRQTRRVAHFPLDPDNLLLASDDDGRCHPRVLDEGGAVRMQGVAIARGDYYATASTGPWKPGSVHVGAPGDFRRHRWATPMGPEDIAYWPSTDLLWSVTEHPRRRWVYAMKRSWFDRR